MSTTLFTKRYKQPHGRHRKKRPKTFISEDAAKKYAESNHIKKYELVNIHPAGKISKIKIVVK